MWYPFNFLTQARPADSYVSLTGLTDAGLYGGENGAPMPDFPITITELDTTQILSFEIPNLEKRISTAYSLPRQYNLTYVAILPEELYHIRQFYRDRKGRFEQFNFIDPEKWTFDPVLASRDFVANPLLATESEYVIKARFNGNLEIKRENKNFYYFDIQLIEVFT